MLYVQAAACSGLNVRASSESASLRGSAALSSALSYVYAGHLADLAADLNASVASAGQIATAFAITYALTAPLVAGAVARFGRRTVMVTGLLLIGALSRNCAARCCSWASSSSPQGRVRYQLKTPWKNGTTHVEFEPVDFIAKLAALVPPPRTHLTRFHGVFAPNAKLHAQLTPSRRGKRPATDVASAGANSDHRSPIERRRAMTWAQRLKRVFNIDVSTCGDCGGAVRIVASIEEPTAIRAILAHFAKHGALEKAHYRPAARAPPALTA